MVTRSLLAGLLLAAPLMAQTPDDPFPEPIPASEGAIRVNFVEFATVPDVGGEAPRVMHLVTEPGTRRMFALEMQGPIFSISYDGRTVARYVDASEARWGVQVNSQGRERGIQSFAFHPQFGEAGTPGYGKFYTWSDSDDTAPAADFTPREGEAHHTVLHEWTASEPAAATYDGGPPREILRLQQPSGNHNGGQLAFNPLASPGDVDFGLLYVGIADGGSSGDPQNLSQDLSNGFGKIFRIDPLGSDSRNGQYGIPGSNPFAGDGDDATLGEIFAYGVRNPQRFAWDAETGRMFMADIGQNTIEKLSEVTRGANLGWNTWEGSFRYGRPISLADQRGDPSVTYPIAEYAQSDPTLTNRAAASGLVVYRASAVPQLTGRIVWGDNPSGEIFHVSADPLPAGGQSPIRRVLFNDDGQPKPLLELIRDKNAEQGREAAGRADMRLGIGPEGQIMVLNKADGVIRMIVP